VEIKAVNRNYWMYLSLVTDAYTHEIVGHALHDTLDTAGPLRALEMAIGKFPPGTLQGLIHHSDRGSQYCSKEYVSLLQKNGIRVSMTENGDPYENSIAERMNGILKTEWLYHEDLRGPAHAQRRIDEIIYMYNHKRPHMSIGNLTPEEARGMKGGLEKLWKNYFAMKNESLKTTIARQ
jgi:transposase InsO family protein